MDATSTGHATDNVPILKDIDNCPALEIDNDRPVVLRFPPTSIVDTDDQRCLRLIAGTPKQMPYNRIITNLQTQSVQDFLGRSPTRGVF